MVAPYHCLVIPPRATTFLAEDRQSSVACGGSRSHMGPLSVGMRDLGLDSSGPRDGKILMLLNT